MKFKPFSPKQRQVLTWWCASAPTRDREAIICDGAVRSGKTLCTGLSFFCWAMRCFSRQRFALCGRTISGLRRNLLAGLLPVLEAMGFRYADKVSRNILTVQFGGGENTFYLFGGKDESSASLIQGVTLAGALLDEVALMPRSFVEQTCARCSVPGSRLWFSCNPEGPEHWFYREWICRQEQRRALYLHFTMEDNPALTEAVIDRYRRSFSGAFYRRFVLGEWASAQGRVYDFFDESWALPAPRGEMEQWCISCDYGTINPASFGLWGLQNGVWYRVKEYYYDSRREGRQKTDGEYAGDLARLAGERRIRQVIVDPSAASFITLLRQKGWNVVRADNDVLAGIRLTADLLRRRRLVICEECTDAIREFGLYCWDQSAVGDRVRKQNDHAMDEIRYFASAVAGLEQKPFVSAGFVERGAF